MATASTSSGAVLLVTTVGGVGTASEGGESVNVSARAQVGTAAVAVELHAGAFSHRDQEKGIGGRRSKSATLATALVST